ncbi:TCP-1/cpn60 chaperonin family protein [Micromonospora sp. NPDC050397]|uniref:caspase, EACC1-associated type n=1 Tax=Micromonospora sp. NPDC050397 TaxID=3364279 RepID=UPI00384B3F55
MSTRSPAGRYALLVATGEYADPSLDRLRAPQQDVRRLAAVLADPAIGNFTVRTLRDAPEREVRAAIEDLLTDRLDGDLVLLYFSCHGIVDPYHRLYFAASDTVRTRPASTAISRSFVNEQFEACRAAARVLILDCCFAGAFAEGFKSAPQGALDLQVGRGYVVLSACDSYEYAFESGELVASAPRGSIFTDVLIEGLVTGAADLDGDGLVGVDELFRFVHDGVVRRRPEQQPKYSAYNAEPHIYLATVPPGSPRAASLTATGTTALARAPDELDPIGPAPVDGSMVDPGPVARIADGIASGVDGAAPGVNGVVSGTEGIGTDGMVPGGIAPGGIGADRIGSAGGLGAGSRSPVTSYNQHQAIVARGFRAGADLIRRTYGPFGRRMLVEDERGGLHEVADAAGIVRLLTAGRSTRADGPPDVGDTRDGLGTGYLRELVEGIRHRVGDGATTGVVLAQSMLDAASAALRAGANPVGLRRGISAAVGDVAVELAGLAVPVRTRAELRALATIAAGDELVGDLVAEAVDRVGRDGVIRVEASNLFGLELELTEGMSLRAGHVSPAFVTDAEEGEAVLDEPYVLIVNDRILGAEELLPLLTAVEREGRPLAVFAHEIRDAALGALVQAKARGHAPVAVTLPWPAEQRAEVLADLAALTGATVLDSRPGAGLDGATTRSLGRARRVVTTRGEAVVLATPDPSDRTARAAGGVAVIKVGEVSAEQQRLRRRQVDHAVRNAKVAVEWGLVAGGGAALLGVHRRLADRSTVPVPRQRGDDEALGYALVVDALPAPFEELLRNAGRDPTGVPEDLWYRGPGVTFDVAGGRYVVARDAGIVDAAATVREAVTAAAGVVTRYLMLG